MAIPKTKFYRFLGESKILQNADEAKTEEMLKQAMVSWGRKAAAMTAAARAGGHDERVANCAPYGAANSPQDEPQVAQEMVEVTSLDRLETIRKSLFEAMFHKAIIHRAVINALKLLETPHGDGSSQNLAKFFQNLVFDPESLEGMEDARGALTEEFLRDYADDEMAATFQVLKLQREYLYQTFHDISKAKGSPPKSSPGRVSSVGGPAERRRTLGRASTKEIGQQAGASQPASVDPVVIAKEMRAKLQAETSGAVWRMSEYALRNPYFDRHLAQAECAKQVRQAKQGDEARERERRRQARVKALEAGYDLKDFNFNDEAVLLGFGLKPARVFTCSSDGGGPAEDTSEAATYQSRLDDSVMVTSLIHSQLD